MKCGLVLGFAEEPLDLASGAAPDANEGVGRASFSALGGDEDPTAGAFQIPWSGGPAGFPGVAEEHIEVKFPLATGGGKHFEFLDR